MGEERIYTPSKKKREKKIFAGGKWNW